MRRLGRKFLTAAQMVPAPVVDQMTGATAGIVSVGSNDPAVAEARDLLRADGIESSYLRIRALPVGDTVRGFLHSHEPVFVVENNHSGQLHQILLSEEPMCGGGLVSVARSDGIPLTANWIAEQIKGQLKNRAIDVPVSYREVQNP